MASLFAADISTRLPAIGGRCFYHVAEGPILAACCFASYLGVELFFDEEDLVLAESVSSPQKESAEPEVVVAASSVPRDVEASPGSVRDTADPTSERPSENESESEPSVSLFSPSDIVRSQIRNASGREQWNLITKYYPAGMGADQARMELQYWKSEPSSSASLLAMSVLFKRWAEAEEPLLAIKEAILLSPSIQGSERCKAVLSAGAFRVLGL